mmetsp:Transcript_5630/g.6836  ORF Transcript_5630/g.6836 Transcript_5630/m.6836 type:complete len:208 (+) Transcript_5630:877-1500(+)
MMRALSPTCVWAARRLHIPSSLFIKTNITKRLPYDITNLPVARFGSSFSPSPPLSFPPIRNFGCVLLLQSILSSFVHYYRVWNNQSSCGDVLLLLLLLLASLRLRISSSEASSRPPPTISITSCHRGFGSPMQCLRMNDLAAATLYHTPSSSSRSISPASHFLEPWNTRKWPGSAPPRTTASRAVSMSEDMTFPGSRVAPTLVESWC